MNIETPLWVTHLSVSDWAVAASWDAYLKEVELLLEDTLVKLDENDPVRRKADLRAGEGKYIVGFRPQEGSKMLFGSFRRTKIGFRIELNKTGVDFMGRPCENAITFFYPIGFSFGPDAERVFRVFNLTNEKLCAFYAYGDFQEIESGKKLCTFSLDVSRELLGVFWLTYFNGRYCDFLGREKLEAIPESIPSPCGGMTFRLAPSPGQIEKDHRARVERIIGAKSFADGSGNKERGQHVLTLEQLSGAA